MEHPDVTMLVELVLAQRITRMFRRPNSCVGHGLDSIPSQAELEQFAWRTGLLRETVAARDCLC